jgi:hypothetical protein
MASVKQRVRGGLWVNGKKKGHKSWIARGSYNVKRGDRFFKLTDEVSGKTVVYESHQAAKADGWKMK